MARPRKPDSVQQLNGAKRRNPGRFKNRGTPTADSRPFGRCPAFLTGLEKAAWREIVENALPLHCNLQTVLRLNWLRD